MPLNVMSNFFNLLSSLVEALLRVLGWEKSCWVLVWWSVPILGSVDLYLRYIAVTASERAIFTLFFCFYRDIRYLRRKIGFMS